MADSRDSGDLGRVLVQRGHFVTAPPPRGWDAPQARALDVGRSTLPGGWMATILRAQRLMDGAADG